MKTKWYFGALIVILTLFGASQENLVVPNQEIVLQFSGAPISSNQAQIAISNVKAQLETIGVSKIEVREEANGRLIIAYYSEAPVSNVKELLSAEALLTLNYASNSKDNPLDFPIQSHYNLDVYEISKSSDTGLGSTGKLIFEFKQDYDRFSNPNLYVHTTTNDFAEQHVLVDVAYKLNKTIAIAINNIPHKIPEGRAGPVL
ncbi:hypothetical protein [Lacinutrix chionoecetis]